MKNLAIICGGMVLTVSMVARASADDDSAPLSQASLSSMGLGGMRLMSDDHGLAVRGTGAFFGSFGHHTKAKLHFFVDHKKFDHGKKFDHRFSHNGFDKSGHKGFDNEFHHKGFDGHKSFAGGMVWQPPKMVWNFGGPMKVH